MNTHSQSITVYLCVLGWGVIRWGESGRKWSRKCTGNGKTVCVCGGGGVVPKGGGKQEKSYRGKIHNIAYSNILLSKNGKGPGPTRMEGTGIDEVGKRLVPSAPPPPPPPRTRNLPLDTLFPVNNSRCVFLGKTENPHDLEFHPQAHI